MAGRAVVGVVDRLGYLWCRECARSAAILELDTEPERAVCGPPHSEERCDICGRRLDGLSSDPPARP